MKLNEKIYFYRKALNLSQEELAERVGVSRQAVSKWELGEATPEVEKLLALAGVFGITTDELLREDAAAAPGSNDPVPQVQSESEFDHAVGFFGRLIRRFGWLAGVYVALSGAGIALVGGIARYAFRAMGRTSVDLGGMMGGFMTGGGFDSVVSVQSSFTRVPTLIATAVLAVGIVILLIGIVLAAVLYRKREQ